MVKKILIIDDDPHIIKMVEHRLQANDYEVIVAYDGKEGFEKFHEESPDLVILDILMPKMDGYTFVRELKKETRQIPVIVLSAKSGMTDLFEAEGITDYIVKPFEPGDLLARIKRLLGEDKAD